MPALNRRQFVSSGLAACACALCPLAGAAGAAPAAGPTDAGPAADYGDDGAYDRFANVEGGFFLVRKNGRLFAPAATCTHKKVKLVALRGALKCPKHGSIFSTEGVVTKGPARKPLDRFGVSIDDRGHVIVDRAARFPKGQWGKPGSFVDVGG